MAGRPAHWSAGLGPLGHRDGTAVLGLGVDRGSESAQVANGAHRVDAIALQD